MSSSRNRTTIPEQVEQALDFTDASPSEVITVLIALDGHTASKRFDKINGDIVKKDYDAGMFFGLMSRTASNILELSSVLSALEPLPNALVIRGEIRPGKDGSHRIQRLLTNFGTPPQGRYWVLLDFDKIALPPQLSLWGNVAEVCEFLVNLLPVEFHDASCHWQLSSSAGMSDDAKVSIHLWFWLDRPVTNEQLKAWGKAVNDAAGYKLIDLALFNDVQAHYTAAPIFGEGVTNPFPVRSGLIEKTRGTVAIRLPVVQINTIVERSNKKQSASKAQSVEQGFDGYLNLIGDHPGGEGFHMPIIQAIASYIATQGADDTDAEQLYQIVSDRVLGADSSQHDDTYIQHMASREHIGKAIDGALKKYGDANRTRRKSRLIEGQAPHYTSKTSTKETVMQELDDAISRWF